MKVISLFSGIGGFDLAFERAGCTVVAQVESDRQCRAVLAEHWPDVPRYDDVRTYHAQLGEADIVVGGFPCQDLSVGGKRLGFGGARSSLFFEMVRIIHECRPGYVVWENVPGLLSANNGRDFASVLVALGNIGYHGAWTMLDAQFFGVAQRRQRVFGVFACGDSGAGRSAEILSLRSRMSGHSAPGREAGEGVACALAAGAGGSKFGSGRQGQDTLIANPLGTHDGRLDLDNDTYVLNLANGGANQNNVKRASVADALDAWGAQAVMLPMVFESRFARNGRGAPSEIVPPLKAQSGETGKGDGAPLVAFAWQNSAARGMGIDVLVPNLETDKSHAVHTASGVRRLTPAECERLQGFDDNWTASQSDSARYRMLGNAVAVPVVEWIARRIVK